ncbi:glycosyltransferase domain-containing protein [Variovorax sp. J31P207]|uniref:glycosyltransferase domain-containing protein n=1 Tax=Variovorax sp. J31P207 TaxID=3053510 RepID=UPI002576A034|nr:glycosyltransferase domain-containing protein [Variovorax sp. J31P207]MDM0067694.1 DUF616 domain-containing protein [Variovorax sp. J31P207]
MASEKNTCVYTVLIGNYEALNEQPVAHRSDIPFICLTDDPSLTSDTWKIVQLTPAFKMDPIRSQRMLKICPHWVDALDGFDQSLYIDNSVVLHQAPELIIERHGWAQGIGLPAHSFRQSVMDEFIEVARNGHDDQNRIFEQLNHYLTYGEPTLSEPPYWTAIMLRDHRDEAVRAAMLRWVEHVLRYSRRDQLSLNAALRESGIVPARWELDNHESWFHTWPHAHRRDRFSGGRDPAASMTPPLAQMRAENLKLQLRLAHALQQTNASIAAIHASTSWRLTSPLRRLKQWLQRAADAAATRPANPSGH